MRNFGHFPRAAGVCLAVAASAFLALSVAVSVAVSIPGSARAAGLEDGVAAYRKGDYKTAYSEFSRLAQDGNARAQFNLGILYLTGRGVAKDLDKAVEWHRKAAAQGLPAAQHGLGVLYHRGRGVPQDYKIAAEWFRRAANGGFPNSQFNLAVMHFNRQGLARDDYEIVKWLSMAAGAGYAPAELRLARMYERGMIFSKSAEDALMWYQRAASHGSKEAESGIARLAVTSAGPGAAEQQTEPAAAAAGARSAAPDAGKIEGEGEDAPQTASLPEKTGDSPEAVPAAPAADKPAAAAPAKADATDRGDPGWRVQLAAFRSLEEAETAWVRVATRAPRAIGTLGPKISRADLGERGIYYRLQAGPVSGKAEAVDVCRRLREAIPGQGCLPVRSRR